MTVQTPVELWEPALARRSLPNGMPLAEPSRPSEWTLLDARVVKGLSSGADEVLWPADPHDAVFRAFEFHPEDAPTLIMTPGTISPGLVTAYARIGPPSRSLSVRYVATPALPAATGAAVGLSAAAVRESLERLRRELRLSARALASLIGVSTRRYYEFRAGDQPPPDRLAKVRDRVDFINRLAARDLSAAAELCRRRSAEVADLLTEGHFVELEELFRNTVRERATMLETKDRPAISGREANELLGVIEGPAFRKILGLIRFLAPTVDARTSERVAAALRMEKNLNAVEDGDPVEDDWEFLLVMPPEAVDGLRERAVDMIRGEAFNHDTWPAFIANESERAWAAFSYRPADATEPELPEETARGLNVVGGWQPDLAAFGVDLSLYDRRTR